MQRFDENGNIVFNENMFLSKLNPRKLGDDVAAESSSLVELFFRQIESQLLISDFEIKSQIARYVPGQFADEMNVQLDYNDRNSDLAQIQQFQLSNTRNSEDGRSEKLSEFHPSPTVNSQIGSFDLHNRSIVGLHQEHAELID